MKEDYDPSFENNNNEERFVKLEDMFSDSAYYYRNGKALLNTIFPF